MANWLSALLIVGAADCGCDDADCMITKYDELWDSASCNYIDNNTQNTDYLVELTQNKSQIIIIL